MDAPHDGVFRGHHLAGARRYRAGTAQKRRIQLIRLAAECYFETVDKETRQAILRNSETPSFEELAGSQGVCPVTEFETLLGHPSAEDESVDDFSAMLRAWRQEGSAPAHSR